jgi:hypothetical protein
VAVLTGRVQQAALYPHTRGARQPSEERAPILANVATAQPELSDADAQD